MKKQIISLILAGATALVFTGCATGHHSKAYDYKIICGPVEAPMATGTPLMLGEQLDRAAAEGWEVVCAGRGNGFPFIVLKRAK